MPGRGQRGFVNGGPGGLEAAYRGQFTLKRTLSDRFRTPIAALQNLHSAVRMRSSPRSPSGGLEVVGVAHRGGSHGAFQVYPRSRPPTASTTAQPMAFAAYIGTVRVDHDPDGPHRSCVIPDRARRALRVAVAVDDAEDRDRATVEHRRTGITPRRPATMSCPDRPEGGVCAVKVVWPDVPPNAARRSAGSSVVGWGRQPAIRIIVGTSTQRHLATRITAS